MIELIRDGRYSFTLKMSKDDAILLYGYLENLDRQKILILFDGKAIDFEIVIDEIDDSLIIYKKELRYTWIKTK